MHVKQSCRQEDAFTAAHAAFVRFAQTRALGLQRAKTLHVSADRAGKRELPFVRILREHFLRPRIEQRVHEPPRHRIDLDPKLGGRRRTLGSVRFLNGLDLRRTLPAGLSTVGGSIRTPNLQQLDVWSAMRGRSRSVHVLCSRIARSSPLAGAGPAGRWVRAPPSRSSD